MKCSRTEVGFGGSNNAQSKGGSWKSNAALSDNDMALCELDVAWGEQDCGKV